jgi:signal transduction histidine kinase
MRVATKLTFALGGLGLVLFGAYGLRQAGHEEEFLRHEVEQDVRLLGHSLQASVENALRDRRMDDISETLDRLWSMTPHVEVFIFDADGTVRAASKGTSSNPDAERRLATRVFAEGAPRLEETAEGPRMVLGLPLMSDSGERVGALTVAYPLDELQAEIGAARRDVALIVVLFVALTALTGLALGSIQVSRPLRRLSRAMADVTAGHLDAEVPPASTSDEIGELTRTFNQMTHELRDAWARLTQEIERRRALEARLAKADKLIAVGQLAASLAHEIGSPLQVLVGRARALATRDYPPERIAKHATVIADQAERIAGIVQKLLDYAPKRGARVRPTSLPRAAESVVDLLGAEAERRSIEVETSAEPDLPQCVCNEDQFQQVVFNLLRNALDASDDGAAVKISFRAKRDEEGVVTHVEMTVADEGSGIAADDLPHVFEPFFTTRSESGGTGLGLVVTQSIVREEGGTIELSSRPGKGTRAIVCYRVEPPAGVSPEENAGRAPGSLNRHGEA